MTVPDEIDLERHRDLVGRASSRWWRRALILALLAVVILALTNAFGQKPTLSIGRSSTASLSVRAPARLRGGLIYQARFEIRALRTLRNPSLVLGRGWLDGMTLNTLEPAPSSETSANGQLKLQLGRVAAGSLFVQFVELQVNPTTVTRRHVQAWLLDGSERVATLNRTITVFP